MKDAEGFTTFEVVRILGINRNTLQVWLQRKWIIPSIKVADGRAGPRGGNLFNRDDLYRLHFFNQFGRLIKRKKCAELAKGLDLGRDKCSLWLNKSRLVEISINLKRLKEQVNFFIINGLR